MSALKRQIDALQPILPDRALITVGRYTLDSLIDTIKITKETQSSLIRVLHRKDLEHKTIDLDPHNSIEIDSFYEPHYWFDLSEYFTQNTFKETLETRIFDYHKEILSLTNLSEGTASGMLPQIHEHLAHLKKNTLGLGIFPSLTHSSDALFNAFSCVGQIFTERSTPMVLIDQGHLESFTGVNRIGEVLQDKEVLDYIVEMIWDKPGFIRDLYKLSNSYEIRNYGILFAAGCSMDVYEHFRNILEITLEQPLFDFDITTATIVYVLVRAPIQFRDRLTKGQIEYEVNKWLLETLNVDIPQICEPIYVEEYNDRIDVLILVGGFDTSILFKKIHKRIKRFSDMNVKQGLIEKDLWDTIKSEMIGN